MQQEWSGELEWSIHPFILPAGTNTIEWRYVKDASTSIGLDAAFIDNINLPLALVTNGSSPAQLRLSRQADGTFVIDLLGQTDQEYVIQASTNLIFWQNISTNIALGGRIRIADPASGGNRLQFYRAFVPAP